LRPPGFASGTASPRFYSRGLHAISNNQSGHITITLINVFTVEPGKQDELVQNLSEATEKAMKRLPGFVSANIHKSLDGTRVVNYAQWRSKDDFEAMLKNPEAGPHMKAAGAIAKFEPHLYAVAAVHTV
jgi:heme-degrading monooxygenase HmoA